MVGFQPEFMHDKEGGMSKRSVRTSGATDAGILARNAIEAEYRRRFGNQPCNGARFAEAARNTDLFRRVFPEQFISDEEVDRYVAEHLSGPGSFLGIPDLGLAV